MNHSISYYRQKTTRAKHSARIRVTVPRLWRSHNPRLLAYSQPKALSRECLSAQRKISSQRKIPVKSKSEPHHMKIKVVKERKENGSLVYKDLEECVRMPEGHLKHQRMFGCGLKFLNSHTNWIFRWAGGFRWAERDSLESAPGCE